MTPVRIVVLAGVLLYAVVSDVQTRRIPNLLTLPGILAGLAFFAVEGGVRGLLTGLAGTAAGVALLFLPFAYGGMGAGDVKLLAVVGAFGGPRFAFVSFLGAALFGGVVSGFVLWREGRLGATLRAVLWGIAAFVSPAIPFMPLPKRPENAPHAGPWPGIPYAVAITVGTVAGWLWQAGWLR